MKPNRLERVKRASPWPRRQVDNALISKLCLFTRWFDSALSGAGLTVVCVAGKALADKFDVAAEAIELISERGRDMHFVDPVFDFIEPSQ